jgi:hypothetical protein
MLRLALQWHTCDGSNSRRRSCQPRWQSGDRKAKRNTEKNAYVEGECIGYAWALTFGPLLNFFFLLLLLLLPA